MHRIIYTVLFVLCIGYCASFVYVTKNAMAAPHVIDGHVSVYVSSELAYSQNKHASHLEGTEKCFDQGAYLSTKQVEKASQNNVLKSAYSAQYHAKSSFSIPWLSVKFLDLSALWKQQRDKGQKKDVYDYGE